MDLVREIFNDRKKEIDLYFELVYFLDTINEKNEKTTANAIIYDKNIENIIRANSFLMIYNLVESTLINSIEKVYNVLKGNQITYFEVRRELKDIWFDSRFANVYHKNADFNSYKSAAEKMITSIIDNEPLELDRKSIGFSGTLDAETIRKVCKNHGIHFKSPTGSKGGEKLTEVKKQRNDLAHGTKSFVECGRDFTVEDLNKIKKEVIKFLDEFIKAIKKFFDNEEYLLSK